MQSSIRSRRDFLSNSRHRSQIDSSRTWTTRSSFGCLQNFKIPNRQHPLILYKPCKPVNGLLDWISVLPDISEVEPWHWMTLDEEEARSKIAVLNYSSGTTGLPKGVKITHSNLIANTTQSIFMRNLPQPNQEPERWLGFLPLYHAYGQLWSISAALKTHTPVYMMRTFSYPTFLRNIEAHRITHIQTAPPVLVMLAKRPETKAFDVGASLVNVLCGAAPLSRELQNEVQERFGLRVVQTWGMTELTCSALHVPGGLTDRTGSVGQIDPNCSVKLVDEHGREVVRVGERGEILVKGPNVCAGYWRNEQATRDAFDDDGYLRTGDVGVMDERGWFFIVDRKKELIKVKGFQVAPAEMEAVLLGHEAIADCAVVGVHVDHDELPRAYVVLKDEAKDDVSENDIVEWTARRVARHKHLLGGVKFIVEVPKSASGKIQRKILREWAKQDAKDLEDRPNKAKL